MEILYGVLVIVATLILYWIRERKKHFELFKKLGIPGPEPSIFSGNLSEINSLGMTECQLIWEKKYGDLYGIFIGVKPFLIVSELESLNTILFKDASNFLDKDIYLDSFSFDDKRVDLNLESQTGVAWKNMRSKLSATFSSGKIKEMYPLIHDIIDNLIVKIKKQEKNKDLDFEEMYSLLTLELSAYLFLGVKTDVLNNPQNPFYLGAKDLLAFSFDDFLVKIMLCYPWSTIVLSRFFLVMEKIAHWTGAASMTYLLDKCEEVIISRGELKNFPRKDLIQIFLNYRTNYEKESAAGNTPANPPLTKDEMTANAAGFVSAAGETSTALLSFLSQILMHNPHIQNTLREEILNVAGDEEIIPYDKLNQLQYLDQVISEGLRMFAPSPTGVTRIADKDYEVKGKLIPKSVRILIPIWALHRSTKYWKNPDKFDPERFSSENKSSIENKAYLPFGGGPRFCIGQRLALITNKAILARLLSEYKMVPNENTDKEYVDLKQSIFIIHPKNGIHGNLVPI